MNFESIFYHVLWLFVVFTLFFLAFCSQENKAEFLTYVYVHAIGLILFIITFAPYFSCLTLENTSGMDERNFFLKALLRSSRLLFTLPKKCWYDHTPRPNPLWILHNHLDSLTHLHNIDSSCVIMLSSYYNKWWDITLLIWIARVLIIFWNCWRNFINMSKHHDLHSKYLLQLVGICSLLNLTTKSLLRIFLIYVSWMLDDS